MFHILINENIKISASVYSKKKVYHKAFIMNHLLNIFCHTLPMVHYKHSNEMCSQDCYIFYEV